MPMIQIAGYALLGLAAWQALRMWMLDRETQRYRAPDASLTWYLFIPIRWQRRLYTDAGQPLVAKAWGAMLRMDGFAPLGMLLRVAGSSGG